MKTKVAYSILLLVLTGAILSAQKPSFDILPSGNNQKIPEAIIDTSYYNDTAQICKKSRSDSFHIHQDGSNTGIDIKKDSSKQLSSKNLVYLILIFRPDINISNILRRITPVLFYQTVI